MQVTGLLVVILIHTGNMTDRDVWRTMREMAADISFKTRVGLFLLFLLLFVLDFLIRGHNFLRCQSSGFGFWFRVGSDPLPYLALPGPLGLFNAPSSYPVICAAGYPLSIALWSIPALVLRLISVIFEITPGLLIVLFAAAVLFGCYVYASLFQSLLKLGKIRKVQAKGSAPT